MEKKKKEGLKKEFFYIIGFLILESILYFLSEFVPFLTYIYIILLFLFPIIFSLYIGIKFFENKEILYKSPITSLIIFFITGFLLYLVLFNLGFGVYDIMSAIQVFLGDILFLLILIVFGLLVGLFTFIISIIIYFKKK